jgi:hypothetical protein
MKKSFFLILFALVLAAPSFGVKEYYDLSKSIRSLGMGGAFFGLSDDEYALFSNPAGLSLRRTGAETMVRVNGHVSADFVDSGFRLPTSWQSYLDERQKINGNAGLLPYFVSKNFAVGFLIADTKGNLVPSSRLLDKLSQLANTDINTIINQIKNEFGVSTPLGEMTFISDSGLVLGYAQEVGDPNLHLGVNLKGIYRTGGRNIYTAGEFFNSDKKIEFDPKKIGGSGVGVDLDLGASYEMKNLPLGLLSRASLVFSNLLASEFSISHQDGTVPRLNRTLNLGWYTVFDGFAFVDNVHTLVDISNISLGGETNPDLGARTGSFVKKLHLGVELPIGRFSVRGGINQGYLTAGFGLNLYGIRLDAATYAEETEEMTKDRSRRYAVTVALGWGSAPPAPISATPEEKKSVVPVKEPVKEAPKEVAPVPATSEETQQPKN